MLLGLARIPYHPYNEPHELARSTVAQVRLRDRTLIAAASPRRSRSRAWLAFITVPGFCCLAFLGWNAIEARRHPSLTRLAVVCEGRPTDVAVRGPARGVPRRVVWLERHEGRWRRPVNDPVEPAWRAEWADDAQLVVCAEPVVERLVERCPLGSGRPEVRVQYARSVRLVVGATGQLLAQETLLGDLPEPCSAHEPVTSGEDVGRIEGTAVSDAAARAFLRPYVTR